MALEQVLEVTEDRVEPIEEQEVIEISTEYLGQVGGGNVGVTL